MKIKIKKRNGKSRIFLDDQEVTSCKGYEIISRGGDGFVTVNLTILCHIPLSSLKESVEAFKKPRFTHSPQRSDSCDVVKCGSPPPST